MDKVALITGASSGIGAACAEALAEKGFRVCITARRKEQLESLTDRINKKAGGREQAIYFCGDITRKSDREYLVQQVLEHWGRIDVLVNNAGTALAGAVEDVDLERSRELFNINLFAPIAMIQLIAPIMRRQKYGRIINMSSISGKLAFPGLGLYAASKFALEAASDAARREYYYWGIKVVLIEPGIIDTEIWKKSRDQVDSTLENWRHSPFFSFYQKQKRFLEKVMLSDLPSPDIVARAVCRAACVTNPRVRYSMPFSVTIKKRIACLPAFAADWLIRRSMKVEPED